MNQFFDFIFLYSKKLTYVRDNSEENLLRYLFFVPFLRLLAESIILVDGGVIPIDICGIVDLSNNMVHIIFVLIILLKNLILMFPD